MRPGRRPLEATLATLATADPRFGADIGRPSGVEWTAFDDVVAAVPAWIDALAAQQGGHRDVAGSFLAGWLSGAAVIIPTVSLVLTGRLPDPRQPLWIRRADGGYFDRLAFEDPTMLVEADDEFAGHEEAIVADRERIFDVFADTVVQRMEPVLGAIRRLVPYGWRGLWSNLSDEITGAALWAGRVTRRPPTDALTIADALETRLAANPRVPDCGPTRSVPVDSVGGPAMFIVRSACCLYFKTRPQRGDCASDAYCATCPLVDDAVRNVRLSQFVADERAVPTTV